MIPNMYLQREEDILQSCIDTFPFGLA